MNLLYFNHELFIRHMSTTFSKPFQDDDVVIQLYQLCVYPDKKQSTTPFIKQCKVVGEICFKIPSSKTMYNPFSFFNSLPRNIKRSTWARSFDLRKLEHNEDAFSFPHIFNITEYRIDDEYKEHMDEFHAKCRQFICDFFPIRGYAAQDQHQYTGIAFYQKADDTLLRHDNKKWKVRGEMLLDLQDVFNTDHKDWECWITIKYKGKKEMYENEVGALTC